MSTSEYEEFRRSTATLVERNPEMARSLLQQLRETPRLLDERKAAGAILHLEDLCKVGRAKLQQQQGKGKVAFFAYLSDGDKARVLTLTNAPGAGEVIDKGACRTSFFAQLPGEVKYNALKAWNTERQASHTDNESVELDSVAMQPIPTTELAKHFLTQGVPMIGFGFADNFLMISFGGTIDEYFGLYVSTLAAAGLGNLLSNIVGLGLAEHIEHFSARMGVPKPMLSARQRTSTLARSVGFAGIVSGVTAGCLLGLAPLLWMSSEDKTSGT